MFYDDLVSNLFLRQYHSSAFNSNICNAPETVGFRNSTLPELLTDARTKICSPLSAPLIRSDFEGPQPISLANNGKQNDTFYSITPTHSSWEHKEDRRSKFGLISEFVSNMNTSIPHTVCWYLDGLQRSKKYFIQIRHMRTYLNAGVSFIHLAKHLVSTLLYKIV